MPQVTLQIFIFFAENYSFPYIKNTRVASLALIWQEAMWHWSCNIRMLLRLRDWVCTMKGIVKIDNMTEHFGYAW